MDTIANAGALLRIFRLRKNWSLGALCSGIHTESCLEKTERGDAQPNQVLLLDLFQKCRFLGRPSP